MTGPDAPDRLDGRAAIVTGAGRGLGEAIAIELAGRGARVLLADIDADAAELAAASIRDSGGEAESAVLDVADWAAVHQLVADFTARAERLDVFVNNAARSVARSFWEIDPAEWDDVMAVNLRGVVAGCRAAGAVMREAKWGRIVNLASLAGQTARPSGTAYAASKAGVVSLTRSFALELSPHGVTVNAIAPGMTDTPMIRRVSDETRERLLAGVPTGHLVDPAELAALVRFLASAEAASISGATYDVNGGTLMR